MEAQERGPGGTFGTGSGLEAELGHGMGVGLTSTHYAGPGLSQSGDWRIGWRPGPAGAGPGFPPALEGTRCESADGSEPPGHGATPRGMMRR